MLTEICINLQKITRKKLPALNFVALKSWELCNICGCNNVVFIFYIFFHFLVILHISVLFFIFFKLILSPTLTSENEYCLRVCY